MKYIIYSDSRLLLIKNSDGSYRLPDDGDPIPLTDNGGVISPANGDGSERFEFDGYTAIPGRDLISAYGDDSERVADSGLVVSGLRESWARLPAEEYAAVAKGAELLNWSASTRYCSRCGEALERASAISKKCPACGNEIFPSLWPAIVVLVIKDSPDGNPENEEALLVHARTLSRPGVKTLVAGFVETGESLETCVAREVREETSLEISDIRYVGSQSWPFPHQLMLGFIARYKGGEMRFADGELTSGGFFTRDRLPELPTLPSLSRRIIDSWVDGKCADNLSL